MTKPKSRAMIKNWTDVPNFIIKSARLSKGRFGAVMWMALIRHIREPANEWTVVEDGGVMQEGCKVEALSDRGRRARSGSSLLA